MAAPRPGIYFDELQANFFAAVGGEYKKLADQRFKNFRAAVREGDERGFESIGHL